LTSCGKLKPTGGSRTLRLRRSGVWSLNQSPILPANSARLKAAIDPSGGVHFVYQTDATLYAHFDGSSWTDEFVYANSYEAGIGVDSGGNPKVLLLAGGPKNSSDLLYATRSAGSWNVQPVASGPGLSYLKVALDPVGLLHFGLQAESEDQIAAIYGYLTAPDMTASWRNIKSATKKGGAPVVTAMLGLTNRGTLGASGFTVNYYLSNDNVFDGNDQRLGKAAAGSLGPSKNRVLKFSFKPPGSVSGKFLIAQITSAYPESEANTNNNLAVVEIP
jgi:hypothetical protein